MHILLDVAIIALGGSIDILLSKICIANESATKQAK